MGVRPPRQELRVDSASLNFNETPDGFLKGRAAVARPGIYVYKRSDGSEFRELVPRSTLEDHEYLASFAGMPLVVEHPDEELVTPETAGDLAVGSNQSSWYSWLQDVQLADVLIWTTSGIKAVREDGKTQLSPCYHALIDHTPGTDPEFGAYDSKQIKRTPINHNALTAAARGGNAMTFQPRSDSEAVFVRRLDSATQQGATAPPAEAPKPATPVPTPAPAAEPPASSGEARILAEINKLALRIDSLEGKQPTAPAGAATPSGPADLDAYYKERRAVEDAAAALNVQASGDPAQMRRTLVQHVHPQLRADSSDEVVRELFEALVTPKVAERRADSAPRVHSTVTGAGSVLMSHDQLIATSRGGSSVGLSVGEIDKAAEKKS